MIEAKSRKLMEGTVKLPAPLSLSPAQTACYSAVMRKGNTKLRACAESLNMDHRDFRKKLFRGWKFDPTKWEGITAEQVVMIQEALPDINEVRKLEDTLLSGFVHLVLKHANSWGRRRSGPVVDFADYVQESVMALLDAIYAYTLEEVKFVTFAWNIIRNRCSSASNRNRPLNPLTNEALNLMHRFEQEKRRLASVGPARAEDVMLAMQVDEGQAEIIRSSLVRVIHSSQFSRKGGDDDQIDFAAYMDTASYKDDAVAFEDDNAELYEAIKEANLTPEESEALTKFMHEERGWETRLAKERNMTRAGISFRVRRAIEKVKAVLLRNRQEVV